jgi:hypothetical protein
MARPGSVLGDPSERLNRPETANGRKHTVSGPAWPKTKFTKQKTSPIFSRKTPVVNYFTRFLCQDRPLGGAARNATVEVCLSQRRKDAKVGVSCFFLAKARRRERGDPCLFLAKAQRRGRGVSCLFPAKAQKEACVTATRMTSSSAMEAGGSVCISFFVVEY